MKHHPHLAAASLALGGLALFLWITQGCTTKQNTPTTATFFDPLPSPTPTSTPLPSNWIDDFEDGNLNMNPTLVNSLNGFWQAFSWAGNETNINSAVESPGANGTNRMMHVWGTLVGGGTGFPGFTLRGKFRTLGLYDATSFTGIRYYYRTASTDAAANRLFQIAVAQTTPPSDGGTCTATCFDHFRVVLTNTAGSWTFRSHNFSTITQAGWGTPVSPPGLLNHLDEVVFIQWIHDHNNDVGSWSIDYAVDEVEFF